MSALAPALRQPAVPATRTAAPVDRTAAIARPWLHRWHARHTTAASFLTLAAAAAITLTGVPALGTQLVVLAGLVALTGLPHGAADHLPARDLLRPQFGRGWVAVFGAFYVGVAAFVLVAWLQFPPVMLTLFLLLAVQHFGAEDANPAVYGRRRLLPMVLHGLIPVAGAVLFHVEETATLFAWLLPGTSTVAVLDVLQTLALGLPLLLAAWAALALVNVLRGSAAGRRVALEIAALVALTAVAPPLLSFGIYFCGWHSVRHVLGEAHTLDGDRPWRGIARFARHAAPVTLGSIALGAAAYAITAAGATPDVALTRVLFIGLAAIAVPHIAIRALHALAMKSRN
ncbi:MAG: Brp/Blh family beta-carotene 15,15'-dioxygenase [Planctomycetota bacterium]|nr:Brp/Blh family beta-carotene 15,15'-dioxygenase [Planctomycetota bacterium]